MATCRNSIEPGVSIACQVSPRWVKSATRSSPGAGRRAAAGLRGRTSGRPAWTCRCWRPREPRWSAPCVSPPLAGYRCLVRSWAERPRISSASRRSAARTTRCAFGPAIARLRRMAPWAIGAGLGRNSPCVGAGDPARERRERWRGSGSCSPAGRARRGGTWCRIWSDSGYRVVNVDLVPLGHPGVDNLIADITDSGQVFDVMTSYADFDELEPGTGVPTFDAVVHFAAIPRILIRPDNETFRVNTIGTYNVIEAAVKLGIRKIVVASSETTYGVCFSDGRDRPAFAAARGGLRRRPDGQLRAVQGAERGDGAELPAAVGRRTSMRSGSATSIEPHEYETLFPGYFANPEVRRRNTFSYIDARDLGQIVASLPGEGRARVPGVQRRQRRRTAMNIPTRELLERFYPGRAGDAGAGRVRGAVLEPQDPRGAGVPRGARLAQVREGVGRCHAALRGAGSRMFACEHMAIRLLMLTAIRSSDFHSGRSHPVSVVELGGGSSGGDGSMARVSRGESAGLGEPQGLPLGRRWTVGRLCGLPAAEADFVRSTSGFSPPVGGARAPAR